MTTYKLELKNLPPLTETQKAELKALASLPDSEIDFSDIPEITDEQWKNAVLYRPIKQQITARIDGDVLRWLKSQGRGYQSRINHILHEKMMESLKR